MSEKGHVKNLESMKKGRGFAASWGAKYAPSNPLLSLPNINDLIADAEAALDDLQTARTPYRNATAAAEDAFAPLNKLTTRVMKALKVSGVPDSVIEDAKTYSRKIQGRAKTAPVDDQNTPDVDESEKTHSKSQMSRTQRVENLDSLNLLLESQPLYAPNEKDVQLDTLKDLSIDLKAKIDAVSAAFIPYSNRLAARDDIFYTSGTGLIYVGKLFKGYVESFGRDSAEWQQIKDLEFVRIGRKK